MINYLSVKKTIDGLRYHKIDEPMKMRYYLATSLIASFSLQLEAWAGERGVSNGAQFAGWMLSLLITIMGTVFIFDINKAHGRFLEKMICLSVPILIQLMAFYFGVSLIVGLVAGFIGKASSMAAITKSELYQPVFEILFALCYTFWLGYSVHKVNRNIDVGLQ